MSSHGTLALPAVSARAVGTAEQRIRPRPAAAGPQDADPIPERPQDADPIPERPQDADLFATELTGPAEPAHPADPGGPGWSGAPPGPGDPPGRPDPVDRPPAAATAVHAPAPRARDGAGTHASHAADAAGGSPGPEDPDEADWDGDDAASTFVGFEDGESEDELTEFDSRDGLQ